MKRNTSVKEGTVIKQYGHTDSFSDKVYTEVYAASQDVNFIDEEGCVRLCRIHLYSDELKTLHWKTLRF